MTGLNLVPPALLFDLGPCGKLYTVLLFIGMFHTTFYCPGHLNTILAMNIMKEPRSHLPVTLSHVCKEKQTLLKD